MRLTSSADRKMRMTLRVAHRLHPGEFTGFIANYLHEAVGEKAPHSKKQLIEIVRQHLAQLGIEQQLDYNDDNWFDALAIVDKAFPEWELTKEA